MKTQQQKLVDLMFEVAMASANYMHGRTNEEIAEFVRKVLSDSEFPTTAIGASWGVLDKVAE